MLCPSPSFLLALAAVCAAVAHAAPPHVIFIVADDLGFDDVGFRSHQIRTPNIDALAKEGVVLDQYYVQDVCSPSRAALLTGRYPIHHSIDSWIEMDQAFGLPLNVSTIADHFQQGGYATHAVGKWHLGFYKWQYTPTFRGFQSFYGFYGGGEDYFTHETENAYDFRRDSTPKCGKGCSQVEYQAKGQYSTELFASAAQAVIRAHDPTTPLFLYLPFQAVHSPAQVPERYVSPYNKTIDNMQRRVFAGMLSCLDEAIGNVTSSLDEKGMLDNAIIIFTTDNGGPVLTGDAVGARNYPLRGGKHSIWEGGVRGTALLWKRDLPTAGTQYEGLIHGVDWLPTLLDATGQEIPTGIDGVSQWQALLSGQGSPRGLVYTGVDQMYINRGLRNDRWKLLLAPNGTAAGGSPSQWVPPVNSSSPSSPSSFSPSLSSPSFSSSRRSLSSSLSAPPSCVSKTGTCYPGHDLSSHDVQSPDECCQLCASVSGCVVWTFRYNQQPSCYLKSSFDAPSLNASCVSGFPLSPPTLHLFDLSVDPDEHNDVAAAQPQVVSSLVSKLLSIEATQIATATDDPSCGPVVHPIDPHVGPVWEPWC